MKRAPSSYQHEVAARVSDDPRPTSLHSRINLNRDEEEDMWRGVDGSARVVGEAENGRNTGHLYVTIGCFLRSENENWVTIRLHGSFVINI